MDLSMSVCCLYYHSPSNGGICACARRVLHVQTKHDVLLQVQYSSVLYCTAISEVGAIWAWRQGLIVKTGMA